MVLTADERKQLLDEFIEKAKTALALEAKSDIEAINKLIVDQRAEHQKLLKDKMTEADFTQYEVKSQAAEKKFQDRVDAIETKMARVPLGVPGEKEIKAGQVEYKASFFNFVRTGRLTMDAAAEQYDMERRALVSDAVGLVLLPEEVESEIYLTLPKINIIRQLATVRSTMRSRLRRRSLTEVSMGWGKLELGGAPSETDVVPGEDWQYVEDLEGLAKIGKDELADSDVSLEAILANSFARARAEAEETAFVSGTAHANQQPEGILNGAVVTRVKTAAADAIAADDILNLIYAVPAQYRRNGKLLVPSTTELAMRKLTSGTDDLYMWQPQVAAGQPPTFAGYPTFAQEDIPAIASGAECDIAIFGDFNAGYRIVDRAGMTLQRLLEVYATAGLIGLLASSRTTGGVIRADALRVLQELA